MFFTLEHVTDIQEIFPSPFIIEHQATLKRALDKLKFWMDKSK